MVKINFLQALKRLKMEETKMAKINAMINNEKIVSFVKLRSLDEIKQAEQERHNLLINELGTKNNPNDSNKREIVRNYWVSDYDWFVYIGEISALRWLMGKNWSEDLNLQALEKFFEAPDIYCKDQQVINFVKAFLCPVDNEYMMISRSVDEVCLKLQELCGKVWYEQYLKAENRILRGIETFPDDVWEKILKIKQEAEQTYGKENLTITNYHDWLITVGQYFALYWSIGKTWDFADDIEEFQEYLTLHSIITKNNNRVMLSGLIDKKQTSPMIM